MRYLKYHTQQLFEQIKKIITQLTLFLFEGRIISCLKFLSQEAHLYKINHLNQVKLNDKNLMNAGRTVSNLQNPLTTNPNIETKTQMPET